MSDINLLPVQEREKEFREIKKKAEEKRYLRIEVTKPEKKSSTTVSIPGGFWFGVKVGLKNFFNKIKTFRKKEKAISQIAPPLKQVSAQGGVQSIPKHWADIQVREPKKKFFYRPISLAKEEIKEPEIKKLSARGSPRLPRGKAGGEAGGSAFGGEINKLREKEEKKEELEIEKREIEKSVLTFQPQAPVSGFKRQDRVGEAERLEIKKLGEEKEERGEREKEEKIKKEEVKFKPPLIKEQIKTSPVDINLIPTKIKSVITTKQRVNFFAVSVVTCLVLILISYVFLGQLASSRETKIKKIEAETQVLIEQIAELKKNSQEVDNFINLLKETRQLLEKHTLASQLLSFLEQYTLKNIYYSDLQTDFKNMSVSLVANAKDYKTLAEQLLVFQSLEEVIRVDLSEAKLELEEEQAKKGKGEEEKKEYVTFNLTLKLKPEVVRRH